MKNSSLKKKKQKNQNNQIWKKENKIKTNLMKINYSLKINFTDIRPRVEYHRTCALNLAVASKKLFQFIIK